VLLFRRHRLLAPCATSHAGARVAARLTQGLRSRWSDGDSASKHKKIKRNAKAAKNAKRNTQNVDHMQKQNTQTVSTIAASKPTLGVKTDAGQRPPMYTKAASEIDIDEIWLNARDCTIRPCATT